jgi:CBS domain-containing protein
MQAKDMGQHKPPITAADIMTCKVVTVQADAALGAAVQLMLAHHVSGLPVLDAQGAPAGMLTEADLLRRPELQTEAGPSWMSALFEPGRLADAFVRTHGRTVFEVMTPEVISVPEATPLRDVVALMQARRIKRVVVLRDQVVVGIVARADLVRALGCILDAPMTLEPVPDDASIRRSLQSSLNKSAWAPAGLTFTVTDGSIHL